MSYTFFDLKFEGRPCGGVAARMDFLNGYTASVVIGPGTYGASEGLYELAVMHDGRLVYDTEVTPDGDVLGWLNRGDVTLLLNRISALPLRPRNAAPSAP